ncbi:P-loop containing nucleoside triphosphate hydrolase protein [Mycena rebaudengoi]|nr:P-loop containing nucleoside triphosphate hydrolase protein [Mycena rebaudengoi]
MTSPTTDDFVNIWVGTDEKKPNDFHNKWSEHASAKHENPALMAYNALRKIYGPSYSMVMTSHNVLGLPAMLYSPMPNAPLVTNTFFVPVSRNFGKVNGVLVDQIEVGAFQAAWDKYDFVVYVIAWLSPWGRMTRFLILHEGAEEPPRSLVRDTGSWEQNVHEEIWVFNQGFWRKDHGLWVDIQTADWDDVILKDEFKQALHKDVYGFFKSEAIYKQLAIPWKRGIIMHGPPGNGKTISIKAIMKTCDALGFAPLYIKSFKSTLMGEEWSMQEVFDKARQLSPCVIVLEDLDALINDDNRSYFMNQLDGLQGNDGLLVIGTTNHFDRLDPGLSTRPSRFDRKYLFDDPDRDERSLYAKYWQKKLKNNKNIEFPDALVDEIAEQTAQFSFAYLKEVFVSALVTLASFEGDEKDKPSFAEVLKAQIKVLRKQLDKAPSPKNLIPDELKRDFRPLFNPIASIPGRVRRHFETYPQPSSSTQPGEQGRDFRTILDRIAPQDHITSHGLLDRASGRSDERVFQFGQMQGAYGVPVTPSALESATHNHIYGL